jgi:tetratricopeptide (TPR) repeat protein
MVYAAHALFRAIEAVRARRFAPLAAGAAAAALVFAGSRALPETLDATDAAGYARLAIWAERDGDLEGALALLERALDERPRDLAARRDRARILRRLGRTEEAERAFLDALKLAPGDVAALDLLADLYVETGRLDDAERLARRLLDASPGYVPAYNHLGRVFAARGDLARAKDAFRAGLAVRPDFNCAFSLGAVLSGEGRHAEAAEVLALAANLPRDPDRWFWEAQRLYVDALERSGRSEDAARHARELARRFPDDERARALAD